MTTVSIIECSKRTIRIDSNPVTPEQSRVLVLLGKITHGVGSNALAEITLWGQDMTGPYSDFKRREIGGPFKAIGCIPPEQFESWINLIAKCAMNKFVIKLKLEGGSETEAPLITGISLDLVQNFPVD